MDNDENNDVSNISVKLVGSITGYLPTLNERDFKVSD